MCLSQNGIVDRLGFARPFRVHGQATKSGFSGPGLSKGKRGFVSVWHRMLLSLKNILLINDLQQSACHRDHASEQSWQDGGLIGRSGPSASPQPKCELGLLQVPELSLRATADRAAYRERTA